MAKFFTPNENRLTVRQQSVGPQATAETFGAGVGRSISELGRQGAMLGVQQYKEAEALRIDEANSAKELDAKLTWDERLAELVVAQEASGDPAGFAASVNRDFEQYRDQQLQNVEGDEAADLNRRLDSLRDRVVIGAQQKQAAIAGNAARQKFQDDRIRAANQLRNFSGTRVERFQQVEELTRLFEQRVDSIPGINADSAAQIKTSTKQLFAESEVNNLIDQGLDGAQEALDVLSKESVFDVIDPARKQALENKARRTVEGAQSAARARWADSLNTEIQQAQRTGVTSAGPTFSREMFDRMIPDKNRADAAWQNYQTAQKVGQTRSQWGWADADEFNDHGDKLQAIVADENASPEKRARASQELSTYERVAQQRAQALQSDPAGYAAQGYPSTQKAFSALQDALQSKELATPAGFKVAQEAAKNALAASESSQLALGVAPGLVQALPMPMMQRIADDFKQDDTEAAYLAIQQSSKIFGDDVMAQIYGMPGMRTYNIIGAMAPGESRAAMFAIAKRDEFEQKLTKSGDFKVSDIAAEVTASLGEFFETTAMQNDNVYSDVYGVTESLAISMLASGKATSASQAAKLASDQVINARYEYVGTARIPLTFNDEPVDSLSVKRTIEALPSLVSQMEDLMPRGMNQIDQDLFREALADGNIRAVTNADESGLMVLDSRGDAILRSNGEPVQITWDQTKRISSVYDKYLRGSQTRDENLESMKRVAQSLTVGVE